MGRTLDEYRELWADPKSGWTIRRSHHARQQLTVLLHPTEAQVAELKGLRELPGPHAGQPLHKLESFIPADGRLVLGTFSSIEAHRILERASALGLRVEALDASCVTYLPVNERTGHALVIEDEELAKLVGERMAAEGMPVVDEQSC